MSTSATAPGARRDDTLTHSRQAQRYLQDRLALLYAVMFLLSAGFYVATGFLIARALGQGLWQTTVHPARLSHLATALVVLALWLGTRQRRLWSQRTLTAIDVTGTVVLCVGYSIMGAQLGFGQAAGLLACTHVVVARSILVPATPRRTFWISTAALVASPPITYFGALADTVVRQLYRDSAAVALLAALDRFLWCVAAVVVATVASKVIYGLEAKVREARRLGQYTLEEKIGEGGMGQVYRARHALLRRPTAVKLIDSGHVDPVRLRRFEREVQLTSLLTHPNTISVYDYGHTPEGVFYYAMEYLDGFNLEQLVERTGKLPAARVIHILLQAAGALVEAHAVGLIHRDIKPANILVCRRGGLYDVVKVLDFGLVKELAQETSASLSSANVLTGTPLYMSPESIVAPRDVDARSDLYALGAVGYHLLTGQPLFAADTLVEVCGHHLHSLPPPLSSYAGCDVPDDLERILLSCLAKAPEERPDSSRALVDELRRCRDAGRWTESLAEAWWRDHGSPSGEASRAGAAFSGTVEVDVHRRDAERSAQPSTRPARR